MVKYFQENCTIDVLQKCMVQITLTVDILILADQKELLELLWRPKTSSSFLYLFI